MNPSINALKASDGSGNASVATVSNSRSPLATTIQVDTVQGINDHFFGTMGAPHTFTDPVTSETITVISEATAVDFRGHVDGSNLEIDEIAPGYTDNGSSVGDIVIIRPTTAWANNVADVLEVSLNDDGTLKAIVDNPGYTNLAVTPNAVTANGNRSYDLVFNSVDLTGTLSPGMRIRTTRTVAAPTQCTSLNGTNQYYSKTSPAGMTFTDDFVVSAWVKLSSYPSSIASVASRYNGTSGWHFWVDTTGQVAITGFNGAATNFSNVTSYQSIPLNKWVHITAQLDMSAYTNTDTTSYVMIDGVNVPAVVARGGTNPTALVQAGDFQVGARNGATSFFPGKIAQVAVFNAKVPQATMRGYISQGLSGTEPSLISAYSFNNSSNDLNTGTANNLSANGSAVATNADSPFTQDDTGTPSGTTDYAIITKKVFSTDTTLTVQVSEGCTIPTSGGVSAVSYSSNKAPYGFPVSEGKWTIYSIAKTTPVQNSPASGTWYYVGSQSITAPIAEWEADIETVGSVANPTNLPSMFTTLSTSTSSETDPEFTSRLRGNVVSANSIMGQMNKSKCITVTTPTPYYLISKTDQAGATVIAYMGAESPTIIRLKLAYL